MSLVLRSVQQGHRLEVSQGAGAEKSGSPPLALRCASSRAAGGTRTGGRVGPVLGLGVLLLVVEVLSGSAITAIPNNAAL